MRNAQTWFAGNLSAILEIMGVLILPALINWGIQALFMPLVTDTETTHAFAYNPRQTEFYSAPDLATDVEYLLRSRLIVTLKPPLLKISRRTEYLLPKRLNEYDEELHY